MLALVPPVGGAMHVRRPADVAGSPQSDMRLFGSGTAALAAALRWAAQLRPGRTEVVLPAYGCPALVSAVLHNGLKPRLVDLAPGCAFPAVRELVRATTQNTIACVHVNFLGLPPPPGMDQVGLTAGALQIYDSCQGWSRQGCPSWADVTVVSFGRGKPITIGGGGGIIPNERHRNTFPPAPPEVAGSALRFQLRTALYRMAVRPRVFWWIDRVPGLEVGVTRFRPLLRIDGMEVHAARLLPASIDNYLGSKGWTLASVRKFFEAQRPRRFRLPENMGSDAEGARLLRLPVLAESRSARDRAVALLRRAGFAGTPMYGTPLWSFAGLEFLQEFEHVCPNAISFADRLLTVPAHEGVDASALEAIFSTLGSL
jgi:dTDP-4-amino-4,6-dideoxygalactose transaminase